MSIEDICMAAPRSPSKAYPGTLFNSVEANQDVFSRFVAHRGANNESPGNKLPHFPENTIPSLREAYAKGALYVECDVHRTQDGRIIVLHDETLRRTGRLNKSIAPTLTHKHFLKIRNEKISQLHFKDEIAQIDVGSYASYLGDKFHGTKISLLEDFLHELKGHAERKLIIEVKAGDMSIVDDLQKLITYFAPKYKIKDSQLLFISFDFELIKILKRFLPNYKHSFLTIATPSRDEVRDDPHHPGKTIGLYHRIKNKEDLDKMIAMAKEANLDGIDVEYDAGLIDSDFMQRIRDSGLKSAVWTYPIDDNLDMAVKMLTAGADLINTNQPEFIFNALQKLNATAAKDEKKNPKP